MKDRIWTVPNILTFSRVFIALAIIQDVSSEVRFGLIAAAILFDFLDGFIARKFNQTSKLGAILDPFFDRMFVVILFIFFFWKLNLPVYFIFLYFLRDMITVSVSCIVLLKKLQRKIEIKARFFGKLVTLLQFVTLFIMISEKKEWIQWAMYSIGLFSLIAIFDYALYLKNSLSSYSK